MGSSAVTCELSCSMWDLVPQPLIRPGPLPVLGAQSPSHWPPHGGPPVKSYVELQDVR